MEVVDEEGRLGSQVSQWSRKQNAEALEILHTKGKSETKPSS